MSCVCVCASPLSSGTFYETAQSGGSDSLTNDVVSCETPAFPSYTHHINAVIYTSGWVTPQDPPHTHTHKVLIVISDQYPRTTTRGRH